ncbi:IS5 family transposase (plasmid) [Streptomyces sp. AHU1]|uniref:IS5 family transposase n=1 Tax=Streptomyces sp. AHU1 TaxID=3377215 RepID=UPI0038781771
MCGQLTDSERQFIGPFLPVGRFGPYPERLREQFEGVIWRFRTGSQWRETPERFGAWQTVYNRFMRWRDAGVFEALLEEAIAEAARRDEIDMSMVGVDSTTTRAHHDAAGMRVGEETLAALEEAASQKRGASEEQGGQDGESDPVGAERRRVRRRRRARLKAALLGRSRGGLTSKIHLAPDRRCRPMALLLTVGQAADSPQFVPVLSKVRVRLSVGRPRTRPAAVAGDKAYSSRANRTHLRKRRIKAVIPEKKDQAANHKEEGQPGGRPVTHDADLYRDRNTVERAINRMKDWRGIAIRYDETPESYLAGLHLRAATIWISSILKPIDHN